MKKNRSDKVMELLIAFIPYVLLAAVFFIIQKIFYQYTYWKKRYVPFLKPTPLLGNSGPLFMRSHAIPDYLQNLYKYFPESRYIGLFDFTKPTVLIKDSELIRDVCIKNFDHFVNHETFVTEHMDPIVGRNLFSLKDQRWKDIRTTLSPSFTASRMKLIFELIIECSNNFTEYLQDNPEVTEDIEVKDAFTRYTSDVIATAAFGIKTCSIRERNNEFFINSRKFILSSPISLIKFELMTLFPKFMNLLGATYLPTATDRFLKNIITETLKIRKEKGTVRQDMIHLLMQSMDLGKVTVDDIIGQAFFFLLAGYDTTSSLMCFTAHELAANPDVQEKLRREVDSLVDDDGGKLNYDTLAKMSYLDMVLSEVMRKYPAAPVTNRICNKTYEMPPAMDGYDGFYMEEGTIVSIPIYSLHHDPKYFPEPEKFDPERFSKENKAKIDPYAYLPFGLGPRHCIGNRLALMEAKIIIASIVRQFVIKFTKKSQRTIVFDKVNFSLTAENGFWFKFEKRWNKD